MTAVYFKSQRMDWATPRGLSADLDREFHFTLDVCADYAMTADEIRFLRRRLSFGRGEQKAPFPSSLLIWRS